MARGEALMRQLESLAASSEFLRGSDLSLLWAQQEVRLLPDCGRITAWADLLDELPHFLLPPRVLPLSLARIPFGTLSRRAIARLAARALLEPDRKGRLTDATRRCVGFERVPPREFTVAEAHVDATEVDDGLIEALLDLGFEIDNFFRIQPPQYKYHFTSQLIVPRRSPVERRRYCHVLRASEAASHLLEHFDQGYAYVETEYYRSDTARSFDYRVLPEGAIEKFPFDEHTFRCVPVPSTPGSDHRRAADIHVKIPSYFARPGYGVADARSADALKSKLIACGFYEIVSEAGNFLYSAHFGLMSEARLAFAQLSAFAERFGGMTGVYCEVCTRMWRKCVATGACSFLAEVPPHLYFRTPPRARVPAEGPRS